MAGTSINSWAQLQLKHLLYAYRKAKADCFFERTLVLAESFVDYELRLPGNLKWLLRELRRGNLGGVFENSLGSCCLVAKKLAVEPNGSSGDVNKVKGHQFFSDPRRAFEALSDSHRLTPEFRIIGDFPVVMHLLSALWINLVGHKFDAALSSSAYGARLRRYRSNRAKSKSLGNYQLEAIGSFQPYFEPYRRWRRNGLKTIRDEIEEDRSVIAISLDLTSYYHRIDPAFLIDPKFLSVVGVKLTDWELAFTTSLVRALQRWADKSAQTMQSLGGSLLVENLGIPIGLSASRIIANVLLIGLDRDIEQGLSPIYYGRYVDDIFLVIRDPGGISNSEEILSHISSRARSFSGSPDSSSEYQIKLDGGYQGRSLLVFQKAKQKTFFLEGRAGLDLLDHIESEIRSVSSERRLMPSPKSLDAMQSARILMAAQDASKEVDTLRKADGLVVRRLGWSIQLRAVETLAKALPGDAWKIERKKFYRFAQDHILRPDQILDQIDHFPRLLSLAVSLNDWEEASELLDSTLSAVDQVERGATGGILVNGIGVDVPSNTVWSMLRDTVRAITREAIVRSLPVGLQPTKAALRLFDLAEIALSESELDQAVLDCREADWARTPYKDHLRFEAVRKRPLVEGEELINGLYSREADLRLFLKVGAGSDIAERVRPNLSNEGVEGEQTSLIPFICPTRPYTAQEISLFAPSCVFGEYDQAVERWIKYTSAVRGVWAKGPDDTRNVPPDWSRPNRGPTPPSSVAWLKSGADASKVLLGISSLLTTTESWSRSAAGDPDLSLERYERVSTIVNHAIKAIPRPQYLLLPELSIPERWIDTVAGRLGDSRISLVAGLDYTVEGTQVRSSAVMVLTDKRLGFSGFVQVRQWKSLPAPKEEEDLFRLFGLTWREDSLSKPLYVHGGFSFGVLVCSELQNVGHRHAFQGLVDCLMILSWNKDLDTFSALVESASLDVHAAIALVNNRSYGDSRVRLPAKLSYQRDLCRIQGGQNEHLVVVEVDIGALRSFQSRAKRWPTDKDLFKPVPEGFRLVSFRKAIPM